MIITEEKQLRILCEEVKTIKENSLWSLLTYRKLFTLNTKIAVEFIINSFIVYYKRPPSLL